MDDFQFCPHHPEGIIRAYTCRCECRKPGLAMIKKLDRRWNIDFTNSIYVGDSSSDLELARKLGVQFFNLNMKKEQPNDIKELRSYVDAII